jgi:hypothetical protein
MKTQYFWGSSQFVRSVVGETSYDHLEEVVWTVLSNFLATQASLQLICRGPLLTISERPTGVVYSY